MEKKQTTEENLAKSTPKKEEVLSSPVDASAETLSSVPQGEKAKSATIPEERRNRRPQGKRRRSQKREDRRPEFDSKIVSIRRVTRVVAGGRRFGFSVALVAGDHKGRVGVGTGKASDTALAIEKAMREAKKNMIRVPLSKEMMLPHELEVKYCAAVILLIPAKGRGVAAGSSVRAVLELAGVTDVTGKILSRSKNQLNNARATIKALSALRV